MKIAIDARWIFPKISGIGSYAQELIRHLAQLSPQHEYILLFDNQTVLERTMELVTSASAPTPLLSKEEAHASGKETACAPKAPLLSKEGGTACGGVVHITPLLLPYSPFAIQSQLFLPRLLKKLGVDVFHSPNYLLPMASLFHRDHHIKYVITIHDLIPILFPHFTPHAKKTRFLPLFRFLVKSAINRADAIIVPSQATKNDVINHLCPHATQKIHVIPEGVSSDFRQIAARSASAPYQAVGWCLQKLPSFPRRGGPLAVGWCASPPAPSPTILYVGRFDPYKGVEVLIKALAIIHPRIPNVRLRIIGVPDPRYPEAINTAQELHLNDSITWSGYVSRSELIAAYQAASVFVLPSRYEGFGLPILEAMACGTPVVCTNTSSLPEVAGQAALLVQPNDPTALAEAIIKVLTDNDTAQQLRTAGLQQAAKFTWERTATLTLGIYEH